MDPLIDKGVAVVTGAGSGIGQALALALAARGCILVLADRDAESLAITAAQARALGATVSEHVVDLGDTAALEAFASDVMAQHKRVSLLVNNAGVALAGSFDQVSIADMEWLFAINFWAPVRLCKAFMPALRSGQMAHIVNISSLFGLIAPAGQSAYSAAKFALRGFSESLRHELEGSGITLSVVHPGGIKTSIAKSARIPAGINGTELREGLERFDKFLALAPKDAAARIMAGIAKREPRILIGNDARRGDILQRLMPATYWKPMRKSLERKLQKSEGK